MRLAPLALTSLLFACGPEPERAQPSIVIEQRSLRTELGSDDVDVVGVTIDPLTHKRYALDSSRGIYELTDDSAVKLLGLDEFLLVDWAPQSAFTDLASLGNDRFAMTALNDGFLLDAGERTLRRYFCYVPEIIEDEFPQAVQLTRSVTFDYDSSLMYAQPQTFERNSEDDAMLSQIGQFSLSGGEGFGWLDIDDEDFLAGGIVKRGQSEMLLGSDSKLFAYDMTTSSMRPLLDLEDLGIERIEALTRDPMSGNLLLVDGASDELFELDLR